jgi:hypothetical protein
MRADAPHVAMLPGEYAGSALVHGAVTRADSGPSTHRHSRCCRDHNAGRCLPESDNADSCRADRSALPRSATGLPERWTAAAEAGIKELQIACTGAAHWRARGFDANQKPGPSSFALLGSSIADESKLAAIHAAVELTPKSLPELLPLRVRLLGVSNRGEMIRLEHPTRASSGGDQLNHSNAPTHRQN